VSAPIHQEILLRLARVLTGNPELTPQELAEIIIGKAIDEDSAVNVEAAALILDLSPNSKL
jgi:hypothetical protein